MEVSVIKVMVVSPHPDDAEIGAGGTIASWVKQGREVFYVVCTNGDKGSSDPNMTSETLAKIRQQEQMEAAKILGVSEVIFLGYPDGGLEDTPAFRGEMVRLIRKHRPDVVLTTDPYRKYWWHRDHRITGTVTMDAIFPYARDHLSYPEHIAEGLTPHRVSEIYFWGSEEPDTFIDIGETFSIKLAALSCHVSQIGQHAEMLKQRIEERDSKIGQNQGVPVAEAFRRVELLY
ncbi:MAG TPA: PIG-L deacetylase family protein [Dehalococcoidia bacterium]|nr:PIG-L deacetylase family protein [Dehalococcoidia bacterium]